MIIKVCGMRDTENIERLQQLGVDFMGLIRYSQSKRFVDDSQATKISQLPLRSGTVGVYVNETFENIIKDIIPLRLDVVQLHGDEDVAFAKAILELNIKVFKAFQIDEEFEFKRLEPWQELAKQHPAKLFFLFDTKSNQYGGSGKKFNWELLDNYNGEVPFLLSGGIKPDDVDRIDGFKHKMFMGVDLNSGFEIEPGIKDMSELATFINKLRS